MTATPRDTHSRNGNPASELRAPFVWFGAKRAVAADVWERFGNPLNYVEPFFGSGAVLLARPDSHRWWERFEVASDADGLLANFFRALAAAADDVARHACNPVTEQDLTARHLWLVHNRESLTARLMADPDFYDARAAGWWAWGICSWVGGDWCTGAGPYTGDLPARADDGTKTPGVYRKIPMISGDHGGKGVNRPRPVSGNAPAVHGGEPVPDVTGSQLADVAAELRALANRLRRVRVACGDFMRVLGRPAQTVGEHVTGVFLDPPYAPGERRTDLYGVGDRAGQARDDADHPSARARDWAISHGDSPKFRIAYCGYTGGPDDDAFRAAGWSPLKWTTAGGYALAGDADNRSRANMSREVVWFSPHCLDPEQQPLSLFDGLDEPPRTNRPVSR